VKHEMSPTQRFQIRKITDLLVDSEDVRVILVVGVSGGLVS
jgi:hypothetical protein